MVRSAQDRMTWICTSEPPTARLRLADPPSSRAMLDGGWWPTSRDPVVELSSLITALAARGDGVIERVMLPPAAWDSHPTRIGVGGTVVRVGWFATLDAERVILTGTRNLRIDLAVTAPHTGDVAATAAMHAASHLADTTRIAAWETEGGHLRPDRHPTAPVRA
ncbi:DUF5994 family protein [Micromonospora tulbaghiae]|uniref:Uncharacterized protein n=1 Tax=Micromonospora tulbaghiae TaxID=479978 RepID=A0AAW4JCS7_9ACTN|nr:MULTISPECIES: DUF5994 family protein [Micromonospora]MBO4139190.1 hypothetical protein [Micromonospora tulbaghiae]MCO1616033.1 DUF5994 family protein [Micromonospora sp. CPM1]